MDDETVLQTSWLIDEPLVDLSMVGPDAVLVGVEDGTIDRLKEFAPAVGDQRDLP